MKVHIRKTRINDFGGQKVLPDRINGSKLRETKQKEEILKKCGRFSHSKAAGPERQSRPHFSLYSAPHPCSVCTLM